MTATLAARAAASAENRRRDDLERAERAERALCAERQAAAVKAARKAEEAHEEAERHLEEWLEARRALGDQLPPCLDKVGRFGMSPPSFACSRPAAEKIAILFHECGWDQRRLACLLECSTSTVSRIFKDWNIRR